MAIGKRLRFEVLKRDGFCCRYCGANPSGSMLHVDHVVPVAEGGTDDPANLVTACVACNLGKSDVSLEKSAIERSPHSPEALREHADQIRAYIDAVKEVEDAKTALVDAVIAEWVERVDPQGMERQVIEKLPYWIQTIGLQSVIDAVGAVAAAHNVWSQNAQRRYFLAVLRNMRDERGADG